MSADIAILIWSGIGKYNLIHPAKWLLLVQIISTAHSSTFELVISWQLIARPSLPLELLFGKRGKILMTPTKRGQRCFPPHSTLRVVVTPLTFIAIAYPASVSTLSSNCTILLFLFIPWLRLAPPASHRGGLVTEAWSMRYYMPPSTTTGAGVGHDPWRAN